MRGDGGSNRRRDASRIGTRGEEPTVMARMSSLIPYALGTAALTLTAGGAWADPVNIMALGDSITAGVGSSDSQFRNNGTTQSPSWSNRGGSGYRQALNSLLEQNGALDEWQFIGQRSNPSTSASDLPTYSGTPENNWSRHFGIPGVEADNPNAGSGTTNNKSLVSQLGSYDAANGRPDIITLHIGSNSSGGAMTTSPANYTTSTSADAQLYRLLDTIRTDADFNTAEKILVARIIPKADAADLDRIIDYNYASTQGIAGAIGNLPVAFQEKIEVVDMFRVAITDAMVDFLAEQVSETMANVRSMIDPGNTGYVDWLDGLNEYDLEIDGPISPNANLYTDITGFDGTNYLRGTSDGTHPSDLGYAIMAWTFGQAIPEPTAVALLGVGAGVLGLRRRRVG